MCFFCSEQAVKVWPECKGDGINKSRWLSFECQSFKSVTAMSLGYMYEIKHNRDTVI